jgi:dienelactone hydrolase
LVVDKRWFLGLGALMLVARAYGVPAPREVGLKASDGTPLKATYFSSGQPGPGVLLLHQNNRTRKSWDGVAEQLAAAGIHTVTLDMRGHGESGGAPSGNLTEDIDRALQYLVSQPGVKRDVIGVGGAGGLGVLNAVEAARRHFTDVKSLVLLSGEAPRDGLQFLQQASNLPELFAFSDDDEYPPTQDAMKLLYLTASSPSKKLVHYSAAEDAAWIWYETSDISKVPATGSHGTDLFAAHTELPGIIVHWFVTTLIKTPGHSPADALACAPILSLLQTSGGAAQAMPQLLQARLKDPQAQLWPEVAVDIIGEDFQRAGDLKDVYRNLQAQPCSLSRFRRRKLKSRRRLSRRWTEASRATLCRKSARSARLACRPSVFMV